MSGFTKSVHWHAPLVMQTNPRWITVIRVEQLTFFTVLAMPVAQQILLHELDSFQEDSTPGFTTALHESNPFNMMIPLNIGIEISDL